MPTNDMAIAAEALARECGGYWAAHPDWPVADWQAEVANEETRQGYWFWVVARIAEEGSER